MDVQLFLGDIGLVRAEGFKYYNPYELEDLDEFEVVLKPGACLRSGYSMAFAFKCHKASLVAGTLLCG